MQDGREHGKKLLSNIFTDGKIELGNKKNMEEDGWLTTTMVTIIAEGGKLRKQVSIKSTHLNIVSVVIFISRVSFCTSIQLCSPFAFFLVLIFSLLEQWWPTFFMLGHILRIRHYRNLFMAFPNKFYGSLVCHGTLVDHYCFRIKKFLPF